MNNDNTVENPVIQVMDVVPSDNIQDYTVREPKSKYSWINNNKTIGISIMLLGVIVLILVVYFGFGYNQ
jgi:hypothetical protein